MAGVVSTPLLVPAPAWLCLYYYYYCYYDDYYYYYYYY